MLRVAILIDQQLYSDPDEFWRPTKVKYLDDTASVTVKQDCCNAAYTVDRDGIASTNSYDALKRLVSTIRLGITISNLLDAAGRNLAQTRKGTDGSLITLRSMGYDAATRVIRDTNALGFLTSYSYAVDGNNQSVITTTNADGGTRIETYFQDGSLAKVTGTAAFPVRYEYGVELDGGIYRAYTKEIKLDAAGADTLERTKTYTDGAGRAYKSVFARTGTTTYTFNNADQIVSVTTPPPGTGASAQTTTSYFDALGRVTNIVQADGTAKVTEYFLTGLAKKKYGSRDYPVEYTYDPQGRLKTQTTWTNFAASGGAAVTTWHYDAERGWMTNKVHADGKGTKYGYTAGSRLSSRLWERGTNTSYAFNNFGDLASISYNDGTTPSVTQTYTRRGQLGKVVRDGITTRLFYTTDGQLLGEGYTGGTLDGLRVTNTFDAYLRRTQVAAKNGASALNSTDYTYDTASRLSTVSDGTQSATYSYIANSPLIGQITFKQSANTRMTTTKSYDYLNRLSAISSLPSASGVAPVSFNYSHNDANQRIRSNLADGSYWSYEYDSLGQVKSGKRYWSDGTPVAVTDLIGVIKFAGLGS
jgi:YD repeat-containing protein